MSAPLLKGSLGLDDLLADTLLVADNENLWHLRFSQNLTDFDLDSLVTIPDTMIKKQFVVPLTGGPFTLPSNTVLINLGESNVLQVNDVELKEVVARSGTLEYSVKSYVNGYLQCIYELPGLTFNNESVVLNVETTPGTNLNPSVVSGTVDLADHNLNLTGQSGFQTNTLYSYIMVKTASDAPTSAVVYGGDSVVIELKFVDPKVKFARGYFGAQHYSVDRTIDFGYNLPEGSIQIDQVAMDFRIENYVGVDAQIQFENLSALDASGMNALELQNTNFYQQWNITRAIDNDGYITPSIYETTLDQNNSNLDLFIESLPQSLNVQAEIDINPLGDVSAGNDFIYTDQALNAFLDIDIPLSIGMNNLVLTDTIDFNANSDIVDVNGQLHFYFKNGFPLDATIDLDLLDNEGVVQSNLVSNGDIASATNVPGSAATIPASSYLLITMSSQDVIALQSGSKLLIRATFSSPNYPQTVNLYTSYHLDYIVTADANVPIRFE